MEDIKIIEQGCYWATLNVHDHEVYIEFDYDGSILYASSSKNGNIKNDLSPIDGEDGIYIFNKY